ncbi:MAG: glycosyltransferase [bacterium]
MKVLHLIDSLTFGGAASLVKDIFEFQPGNTNIYLYPLRLKGNVVDIVHPNVIPTTSKFKYSLFPFFDLYKIIRQNNIDILHCHLFRSQMCGYILKVFCFQHLKLIFHRHGAPNEYWFAYVLFLLCSISQVDYFIAISKMAQGFLFERAHVPKRKIQLLYNFVNLSKFDVSSVNVSQARTKLALKKTDFVVGFAARIVEAKGWKEFIGSAVLLREDRDIKFVIAGDGIDRPQLLSQLERQQLEKQVIYLGYQSNMTDFYAVLNCFIIPSHFETMGLTEIEAMAMEVPVIASNVPGLNEIIEDRKNGLLFPNKDIKALTDKIQLLRDNATLRKALIEQGRRDLQKYSLPEYLKRLDNIYAQI